MSFGGGYKPPPDNSVQLQREQQAYQDTQRNNERQRQEQEAATRRTEFNTARDAAITDFRNRARTRLDARGLAGDDYNYLIDRAITAGRNATPNLDTNPSQYFTDDLLDSAITGAQSDRRANYTNQTHSTFANNFERGLFADTADDEFINSILSTQRSGAVSALDLARARGSLDQTGYDAAMEQVNQMETAGRAQANQLGGAVLQDYRGQARNVGDRARSAASGYTLGSDFNLGGYQSELNSLVGSLNNNLQGDITTALAGQNFFDIGDILTRGGTAQGPVNPASLPAFMAERERVRNAERGVGGSGTF
jgi:hypothetical protein